jgi:2-amino-4-hydroxy-6-hydroxymethyldihydropteridine diphosphokinase
MKTRAYIALGSNLSHPIQQMSLAIMQIAKHPACQLLAVSRYYQNEPMGPVPQSDFINAAIAIDTELEAHDLLDTLQVIEHQQGRTRTVHHGPRTIDLDLLLYGELQLNTITLTLPHPGITQRNFVLAPLADIAPELCLPTGESISTLLAQCPATRLEPLAEGYCFQPASVCA